MFTLIMEVLLVCSFSVVLGSGNENYTFTYGMALHCKEHISQHGYSYETFYEIDQDKLTHATLKKDGVDVTYFEMHIAIQAASNGHILLSPVPFPSATDAVYEIVVGGGGNKFTELRLNLKRNAKSSSKTPGILSVVTFTAFYIKVSYEGLVEFGREGDSLPLVSYYDANTLPVKYFSFASWTGVEAKFLFDCPPPGASDAITPDSQAVEPKLSNSDELKRNLLMSRMPSIPPATTVSVKLGVKIVHSKLDSKESRLVTRMAVFMSWTDDSMAWDPIKYNGTTRIKLRQGQIWRPTFFVFNSDSVDVFDTRNPGMISVVNSGEASFFFQADTTTFCADNVAGRKGTGWPHDEYWCSIVIEPFEFHEKIVLEILPDDDPKLEVFHGIDEIIQSEWNVKLSTDYVIKAMLWNQVYRTENKSHNSDRYVITVDLKRQPTTYNLIFYTPLLVFVAFLLMSFWTEPILEESKIMFYAGCTVMASMAISALIYIVPTRNVPSIVITYCTAHGGVLIALLMNVFLMSKLADRICKNNIVQCILTFWLLRFVFFLPAIKISRPGAYARQEDEVVLDEELPSAFNSNVEEMEIEDDRVYGDKRDLAHVLNKLMFVVFSITFICIFFQEKAVGKRDQLY